MPQRPPKACNHPGCPNYCEPYSDYCKVHQRPKGRGKSTAPYTSKSRFRKFRAWYIRQHPVCERCNREAATVLHHKTEVDKGGAIYDEDNAMAVCWDCHEIIHGRKKNGHNT